MHIQGDLRLEFIMEVHAMNPESTLTWVHIVCNIGYLRTILEHKQTREVDDKGLTLRLLQKKMNLKN